MGLDIMVARVFASLRRSFPPTRESPVYWHNQPTRNERGLIPDDGVHDMPRRYVILSDHQHGLLEGLVQSGRYQNASEVLRHRLRLLEEREPVEQAKLEALKQAAQQGWVDISTMRFADVVDDQLDDFIGQLGRRSASNVNSAGR